MLQEWNCSPTKEDPLKISLQHQQHYVNMYYEQPIRLDMYGHSQLCLDQPFQMQLNGDGNFIKTYIIHFGLIVKKQLRLATSLYIVGVKIYVKAGASA